MAEEKKGMMDKIKEKFEDKEEQQHLARIVFGFAVRKYKVYISSATDITVTKIRDWHDNYMG